MRRILALAAIAASLGVGNVSAQDEGVYVENLDCVGGRFGLDLPSDIRVVRQMSSTLKEEVLEVERWHGYTTERKLLKFDGLTLEVIEFSNDPSRFMLTFAAVTSPKWNSISPFKLWRPVTDSATVLGDFARDNPGLIRPFEDEGNRVTIHSSEGIVTQVAYHCYPG